MAGFADDDRHIQTPRHQQRFVAEIMRETGRVDQGHAPGLASVTAGEDIEFHAPRFEQVSQQQDERRLARSADGEVSDAHHRAARAFGRGRVPRS